VITIASFVAAAWIGVLNTWLHILMVLAWAIKGHWPVLYADDPWYIPWVRQGCMVLGTAILVTQFMLFGGVAGLTLVATRRPALGTTLILLAFLWSVAGVYAGFRTGGWAWFFD
jgi:hypothetical protein